MRYPPCRQLWTLCLGIWLGACGPAPAAAPAPDDSPEDAALGPALQMTLTASPNTTVADYATSTTLTATLTDPVGRPLIGQQVSFIGALPGLRISPTSAPTNCAGQASTTVASLYAGSRAVFGTYRGIRLAVAKLPFACARTFSAPLQWPIISCTAGGSGPHAVADLNGDGKADLIINDYCAAAPTTFFGNGNGSFQPGVKYNTAGVGSNGFAVGDFNRDGKPDVVAISGATNANVYLNDGFGGLQPPVSYPRGNGTRFVVAADFNQDGNLDFAISGNYVSVNYGRGDGTFAAAVNIYGAANIIQLAVGDINSDGLPDLLVANYGGFVIGLTNRLGFFSAGSTLGTSSNVVGVATGDINGDGFVDFGLVGQGTEFKTYLGHGDGTFFGATSYALPNNGYFISMVDLNRDGRADVLINGTTGLSVYTASPNGLLSPPTLVPLNIDGGQNVAVSADFNGDGIVDISIPGGANTVGILLNDGAGNLRSTGPLAFTGNGMATALADVNKDGKLDALVGLNASANALGVALGNGDGTFGFTKYYTGSSVPRRVVAQDVTADGNLDLLSVGSTNVVSLLVGNGDGTFAPALNANVGTNPYWLEVGDLNADGKPDLVTANYGANTVSVLLNGGNATFAPAVSYATGTNPSAIAIGDLNKDNKPDLIVANQGSNTVGVFINSGGNATFGTMVSYASLVAPTGVAVADYNADGNLDVAIANNSSFAVTVHPGTGLGTFGAYTSYAVGNSPFAIAAQDFDGDGRPDLVVTNFNASSISLLTNNGTSFGTAVNYSTVAIPGGMAVGDLNADGKPDLFVVHYTSGLGIALLNTGCP
jgi:hypothetical protein